MKMDFLPGISRISSTLNALGNSTARAVSWLRHTITQHFGFETTVNRAIRDGYYEHNTTTGNYHLMYKGETVDATRGLPDRILDITIGRCILKVVMPPEKKTDSL